MVRKFAFALVTVVTLNAGCSEKAQEKMGNAMNSATSAAKDAGMELPDVSKGASDALASIEGGSDLLKGVSSVLEKLTSTLSSVKDEATASAALPDLGKLTESLGGMSDTFGKLPAAAKGSVTTVIQTAIDKIKPIIEKVMEIPGVSSILKPAIDGLMAKLESFKG